MKKNAMIIGFMCTILLASSMASIQAFDNYEKGTSTTQALSYTPVVGDEHIYNIYVDVFAEYEDDAVSDDIDAWAAQTMTVGEYFDEIKTNFQIKMDVTQVYSKWVNASWTDGNSYYDEYDMFNASIRAREVVEDEDDGEWVLPTEIQMEQVDYMADFSIGSFGAINSTDFQSTYDNVTSLVEGNKIGAGYDNIEIQGIHAISLINNTAPQQPFNMNEFQQLIFFKPAEYDFKEWLTYFEEASGLNATTYDDMIENAGITRLRANTNGIALVFTSDTYDFEFIEDMTGIDFNSATSAIPTSEFEARVLTAVEYDEDGLLADYTTYYEFSAVKEGERFTVFLTTSLYHDDYSIVDKDQVEDGSVGDLRNLTGFNCPFLNSIPGYSTGAISLIALVSIAGMVLKLKRK
ncbi:MAG: hypothetical protein ACTSWW_01170 [Promethearchaeota archaeon]